MNRLFPCILFLFAFLFLGESAKASNFFVQPTNSVFLGVGGCCNNGAFFAGGRQAVFVNSRGFGNQTNFIQSGGLFGRRNTFFQQSGGGNVTLIQNRGLLGLNRSTFFQSG